MARRQGAILTDEGLLLPARPPGRLMLLAFAAGTLLLLAVTVGLVVRTVLDDEWSNLVGVAVLLLGVVLFGGATAGLLRQDRTGSTGLLLTPSEVRLTHRPEPVTLPWEGITAVEETSPLVDEADGNHPGWLAFVTPTEPPTGLEDELRLLSGSPYPSIAADELVIGRPVARELCRFYLQNPDARAELVTPAALARFELG